MESLVQHVGAASSLLEHAGAVSSLLERHGVMFGIVRDGRLENHPLPFDPFPRVIEHDEWELIERGLKQRVDALNIYLLDIYRDKRIVRDGVIPGEFAFTGSGYLGACEGVLPPKGIMSHISGIDLVQAPCGSWIVLEDNLRIPSGASYPLVARKFSRQCSPTAYRNGKLRPTRHYGTLLRDTMDHVNCGGLNVVFTPGQHNPAFFEHGYLAAESGAVLAFPGELSVEGDVLYYRSDGGAGKAQRVGAVYRRVSDEYLDPVAFNPKSLIGVPNIMAAYRAGNVALLNAPGNGAADDKGIYYFVPKMIEYYLGEDPILRNAPTYLPSRDEDLRYVTDHFDELVVKDVDEAGGHGVVFPGKLTREKRDELLARVMAEPRRWIAQEIIDFQELPVLEGRDAGGGYASRKADLRAFVLSGAETRVWPGGLTRYSREAGSCVVNSSQGGGFKDTWALRR